MGIKAFKAPLMNMILCTECAIKLSQNTKGAHKEFALGTCPTPTIMMKGLSKLGQSRPTAGKAKDGIVRPGFSLGGYILG